MTNNDKNKDDNDIKEKPIDLPTELVITSPSIEGKAIALAKNGTRFHDINA
ncbi:hypothetical protein [Spiroplasma phoeniceum]|uniref:Uncharacterized protein n=1 Tax=Spiroplasma phoeniceum P40 TaxID=1276259 RepID=A0A345DQJ4_9MOLU|nr:hypothetical protein [Spiroplasma phoeniceum]AXF96485.1 hypothetical protein SDAV_001520 [Spiroplasma phoeniceum P40]